MPELRHAPAIPARPSTSRKLDFAEEEKHNHHDHALADDSKHYVEEEKHMEEPVVRTPAKRITTTKRGSSTSRKSTREHTEITVDEDGNPIATKLRSRRTSRRASAENSTNSSGSDKSTRSVSKSVRRASANDISALVQQLTIKTPRTGSKSTPNSKRNSLSTFTTPPQLTPYEQLNQHLVTYEKLCQTLHGSVQGQALAAYKQITAVKRLCHHSKLSVDILSHYLIELVRWLEDAEHTIDESSEKLTPDSWKLIQRHFDSTLSSTLVCLSLNGKLDLKDLQTTPITKNNVCLSKSTSQASPAPSASNSPAPATTKTKGLRSSPSSSTLSPPLGLTPIYESGSPMPVDRLDLSQCGSLILQVVTPVIEWDQEAPVTCLIRRPLEKWFAKTEYEKGIPYDMINEELPAEHVEAYAHTKVHTLYNQRHIVVGLPEGKYEARLQSKGRGLFSNITTVDFEIKAGKTVLVNSFIRSKLPYGNAHGSVEAQVTSLDSSYQQVDALLSVTDEKQKKSQSNAKTNSCVCFVM